MSAAEVQLPPTYKGISYDKPGSLSLKLENELKMPSPGAGEVLVQLTHSGVCHSDMSIMLNGWSCFPYPTAPGQIGGHEGVGRVAKLGPGAEVNCKVGDRVGIKWVSGACGSCPPCLGGYDGSCANIKISGYYTPGTFQQYTLGPSNYVTPIPDSLDSAAAAPLLCGGVTTYSALRKSGAGPGDWVAILGAGGGLGHIATQIGAKGMGMRVIGVDHSSKKGLVMESGAEHFVGLDKEEDVVAAVQKLSDGLGVQACLVLAASTKAYEQSVDLLRFGGSVMVVGIPDGEDVAIGHAYPGTMAVKQAKIQGIAVGDRRDAIRVLDMAARGIVKVHFTVEKMDQLQKVFQEMDKGNLLGRVVLDLS